MTPVFPSRRRIGSLAEVIAAIDEVVDWACCAESPIGYFGAIYGRMTREIAEEIGRSAADPENAVFEDPVRMERFGVVFAKRYLDALWCFHARTPEPVTVTRSWQITFEAAACEQYTIMQHLMLGINAHMRLDLCVAALYAARAEPRMPLAPLETDFERVNDTLEDQIPIVRRVVDELSPGHGPFEWFTWQQFPWFRWYENELLAGFARLLRRRAWDRAVEMEQLDDEPLSEAIVAWDAEVAELEDNVLDPDSWFGSESIAALAVESRVVAYNIGRLR